MQPEDKPPPYSEVAPPVQERQPLLPGGYPAAPPYPPVGTAPPPPLPQQQHQQQGQRLPPPPGGVPAGYGSVTYVTHVPAHEVIIVGGCPACRIGVLEDDFSCLGIFCAIFFFPLGILCCLATRQRRCPNCGAIFG